MTTRLAALLLLLLLTATPALAGNPNFEIRVLSNRADLISGGDALLEVVLPFQIDPAHVRVTLNGDDATELFAVRDDGRFKGYVDGLNLGPNEIRAFALPEARPPKSPLAFPRAAVITLTNHPSGGPVFAGSQLLPWICARRAVTPVLVTVPGTSLSATVNTRASGLNEDPVDEQCNAASTFTYFYQPASRQGTACLFQITGGSRCFEPYDPANPPAEADIADFTNDRGDTVKSIIVVERGALDRALYQLVTFFDPSRPHSALNPQKGWNGKLLWGFGASSGVSRFQTGPGTGIFNHNALSRGFMVASSSLTDHGTNANDTLGAEMMMMVKERIAETWGPIRYTIGTGCSGGSIMQQNISSAYPGLLQGIQPSCSYPDTLTTGIEVTECGLLNGRYYTTPEGSELTNEQRAAINGHLNTGFCTAWVLSFLNSGNPSANGNCGSGFPAALTYDPLLRPDGVRCTSFDHDSPMLGTFIDTDGIRKGNSPFDNEGVQYGLRALRDGVISPEQFVRLNEGVGSFTHDFVWTGTEAGVVKRRRIASQEVLETTYLGGIATDGRQLGKVAIVDYRGNQSPNGDIHMNWRAWSVRERLDRANGHHDNQLIWAINGAGGGTAQPGAALALRGFLTLDRWLAAIEADPTPDALDKKVRRHRPGDATDLCLAGNGATEESIVDLGLGTEACTVRFQASPRQVAGGPLSENIFKCRLKPLNFWDPAYGGVSWTHDQVQRLMAAFPTGVCHWSAPGVGQQPSEGGTTFRNGPGGEPLGPAPVSINP